MVRPIKPRRVFFDPNVTYFKPRAVPLAMLEEVDLSIDELEALRLCDFKNLEQTENGKENENLPEYSPADFNLGSSKGRPGSY